MFDDLATDAKTFNSLPTVKDAEISHINKANGFLEHSAQYAKEYLENCPDCKGTGKWVGGYVNRVVRDCFKCKGTGTLSFKTSPEERFKAQQYSQKKKRDTAEKGGEWLRDNHPLVAKWIVETISWNDFADSMLTACSKYGQLTPNQIAAAQRAAEKHFARQEEKAKEIKAQSVELDAAGLKPVLEAFAKAQANGLKRPKMRLEGFELSLAPASGKNAGFLYVQNGGSYFGKISPEGTFIKPQYIDKATGDEITAKLESLGSNPMEAAIAYGKKTGQCSCCGRELTNPESIELGIGPICREKFF